MSPLTALCYSTGAALPCPDRRLAPADWATGGRGVPRTYVVFWLVGTDPSWQGVTLTSSPSAPVPRTPREGAHAPALLRGAPHACLLIR
jgi:hypothetical protein